MYQTQKRDRKNQLAKIPICHSSIFLNLSAAISPFIPQAASQYLHFVVLLIIKHIFTKIFIVFISFLFLFHNLSFYSVSLCLSSSHTHSLSHCLLLPLDFFLSINPYQCHSHSFLHTLSQMYSHFQLLYLSLWNSLCNALT